MTSPHAISPVRLAFGVCLATLAAALGAISLIGSIDPAQDVSASFTLASVSSSVKISAGHAILALSLGWICLIARPRAFHVIGYVLTVLAAAIAIATLAEHVFERDLGLDAVLSGSSSGAGKQSHISVSMAVALLLASIAIAMTRMPKRRFEDFRQLARVAALAPPLFAVALNIFDPMAISAINGFEASSPSSSVALACLLVAIGFDREAASLRWQLASIGVVVVAPLVALTVFFASAERENALAGARDRLAGVARLGAERQDAVVSQTMHMLTLLSRSPVVRNLDAACGRELAEYMALTPLVKALYVVDRAGVVRCSDQASTLSTQVGDRGYFQRAFATGKFTVSEFILARVSGKPRIVLALPTPEGEAAELLIAASLDVEALANPLDSLGDERTTRGETMTLVDRNGVVIARKPRANDAVGANLADATFVTEALSNVGKSFEAAELSGRATVFFARSVLGGEGTLIVGAPKSEIVKMVDARLNRQLLMISAILACSLALGLLGSEMLVLRPLRRLIAYSGRLEAGDLAARPDVRASGEVGALGRALAVTAAAIEDRERRLAETEALFRGLFDHSPDAKAVIRVEPEGGFRVETWNMAAEAATGLVAGVVVGRAPRDVFPGSRGAAIEQDLKRTLSLGRVQTLEREPSANGGGIVFEMVQVPLRGADGTIERIFLSARDISERKRVERLKNEFVSTVSHELRTPLTSIAGSLGLLSGGAAGPLGERAKHLITIAHSNSLRLVRLINDILDIEKIEAGRMTFELKSLVIGDVVAQSISGLRPYADEFDVGVELVGAGEELMVYGDEDRLTQVVTNLLSNAIKFSPAGEVVTVSIVKDGEAIAITVRDRGPGVPESFRSRMFTKFAQADGSDTRRKGGTGLGLAIVREIVERHAGAVSYRGANGAGSEFEVRLPRHVARNRGRPPTFAGLPKRPKVLVCEDDALMAAILAEQMRDAGFDGRTAGTIRAALKLVETEDIQAVMVDLNLPDGDGLSFIQDLRALPRGAGIPVVVVSADAAKGRNDQRAAHLDVAAWVEKPVDTTRLARLIRQQIGPTPVRPRVLHVEDDADLCTVVSAAIAPLADVTSVGSVAGARDALDSETFDLVILDVALEDGSGLELMNLLTGASPSPIPTIIFSALDTDREVAAQTEAAMTKSRTSLAGLVDAVRSILDDRTKTIDAPVQTRRSVG